jgi:hypothetical protein
MRITWCLDNQSNDAQYNSALFCCIIVFQSLVSLCLYAEFHYGNAEGCSGKTPSAIILSFVMLSFIIMSVAMLTGIMTSVIMVSDIMLSVDMLSVIMRSVNVLSVIASSVIKSSVILSSVIMSVIIQRHCAECCNA